MDASSSTEPSIPAPDALSEDPITSTPAPLSKNAQKKLAKAVRLAEAKKERRAVEKEKRKQKKRERYEKERAEAEAEGEDGPLKKKVKLDAAPQKRPFDARVVVDLAFDELMSENEVKSLTSQLAFTYSANRKAVAPFTSLLFTGLGGRTFTRLEAISDAAYKRWIDTDWWTEGYERLWEAEAETEVTKATGSEEADEKIEKEEDASGTVKKKAKTAKKQQKPQTAPRETVVYLTADSAEELTELKEDETYIIGGIVDHNRYKNLCLKKSQDTNIRSARLPIGTYLSELKTRKVLTVNQTFEILLKWTETRDWEQALYSVVPKRKFHEKAGASDKKGEKEDGEADKVVIEAEEVEQGGEEGDDRDEADEGVVEAAIPDESEPSMSVDPQKSESSSS
ncbi:tRNA (guanine(9)-N(1))-methyltransferase [Steccherinum ochraceum]|uniref:tRNA (guanine(9)-N1)-methyltransferase n=1 Tax=Steccherinum ochraceum TaxID=92696 RepID=A0A4R0R845_9APHY|nr:tRNA (guanine(9)-N(1))-methyltransferase [Steccherinum ochraceum]